MSSTNQTRSSPRAAVLRNRITTTSRTRTTLTRSGVTLPATSTSVNASVPVVRARARSSAATSAASNTTPGVTVATAAARDRAVAVNAGPRSTTASRMGARTITVPPRTSARRTVAGTPRVSTRRSTSNRTTLSPQEEKVGPPEALVNVVSPFSNSTNLNERRLSIFCRTVIYCPICFLNPKEENKRTMVTACGHLFCETCLMQTRRVRKVCPICQQAIKSKDFREIFH